jgi:hypothetical protein
MTDDDPEALWAWLQTPSGADDLGGWKRLVSRLQYQDPRRAKAAARLQELRRETA